MNDDPAAGRSDPDPEQRRPLEQSAFDVDEAADAQMNFGQPNIAQMSRG